MIGFASQFDPHPKHTDPDWSAQGAFGGVIASGFHTLALAWSLYVRAGLTQDNYAGVGIDEVRWQRPMRPGDTLRVESEIVEKAAAARRGRGSITIAHTVWNQHGEVIMTFRTICLINCRPTAASAPGAAPVGS